MRHSPEAVWQAISTVESLPEWFPGVQSATYISGPNDGKGRKQLLRRMLYNRNIEIEQEVVEWQEGRLLSMQHVRETSDGKDMAALKEFHTIISIEPAGEGARVSAANSWESRTLVSLLLSSLFAGRTMGRELGDALAKIDKFVSERPAAS